MGVNLGKSIPSREIEFLELSRKKLAIDAFNICFQFITIIRDRMTGEPLRDHLGRTTSQLSGILYRMTNLLEFGIKPIFVWDGPPPEFKRKTIEEREKLKEEARKKWEEALVKGEKAITYAQAASRFTKEMIEEAKKLLDYLGIPSIQAPSEGEAMCSHLCKNGIVYSTVSQDMDSLLFGSPRLLKNISVSGRRKLPKKEVYIDVKPEIVELQAVLDSFGLTREQLIIVGILTGTDYNEGITGIGPVKALKLVKEHKTLESVLKNVEWKSEFSAEDIFNFFLNPPVTDDYKLEWKEPDTGKIIEFMVEEHDFSKERIEKVVEKLKSFSKEKQASLGSWLEK
jgi:flap endonuclease-1